MKVAIIHTTTEIDNIDGTTPLIAEENFSAIVYIDDFKIEVPLSKELLQVVKNEAIARAKEKITKFIHVA